MRSKRYDRFFLIIKCSIIIYIFFYVILNIVFLYNAVQRVSEAEESIAENEKLQNKYQYNSIYSKYENITNNWMNDLSNARNRSKLYLSFLILFLNQLFVPLYCTEDKGLSLTIITLISIPIHLFGLFGVLKESFTITVTYTVVVTIFSFIHLFTNPFSNWILLVIQIIFNLVMILYCYLIYRNKRETRETIMRVDSL
jgi:hypothetical protein